MHPKGKIGGFAGGQVIRPLGGLCPVFGSERAWFHTYLPARGTVTVRLGIEDIEIVREIDVRGWTRVEGVLEPHVLAQ